MTDDVRRRDGSGAAGRGGRDLPVRRDRGTRDGRRDRTDGDASEGSRGAGRRIGALAARRDGGSGGVLLLAVLMVFVAEALRTSGPLLDHIAGGGGVPAAALTALIVYAAPVAIAPLVRWLRPRQATRAVVLALVVLRLAAQLQHTPGFIVAMVSAMVAIGALVLVADQIIRSGTAGGVRAALGLVLGGALDVALRGAFGTWDAVWRPGVAGWLYAVLACVVLVVALTRAYRGFDAGTAAPRPPLRLGVLGVYLALYTLALGSPAFVASQGGVSQPWAVATLLVGALLGVEAVSRLRLPGGSGRLPDLAGRPGGVIAAVLLVATVAVALFAGGILVVPVVIVAQVAVAVVLARAFAAGAVPVEKPAVEPEPAPRRPSPRPIVRASTLSRTTESKPTRPPLPVAGYVLAGLGTGFGFVVIVLGYQVTYDLPLPFDNRLLPIAGAILLGLAGIGLRPAAEPAAAGHAGIGLRPAAEPAAAGHADPVSAGNPPARSGAVAASGAGAPVSDPDGSAADDTRRARRGRFAPLAGVPAVLLLVPVLMLVTSPAPAAAPTSPADTVRVVTWNLHYGVNNAAAPDPATIARVLHAAHPNVILLQEVNRGWPIGAGTDLAEYLSRAMAMPYVWSPAADGQFGNMILSSLPMSDVHTGRLPYGAGPQRRSYASAKLELDTGRALTVYTTHLQNHTDNHATRIDEINTILRHWHHTTPAIIGGDFNAMPGWPEIARFESAGLVSAQDSTGHSGKLSSPTDTPRYRPDWIFGTSDLSFQNFTMPHTPASDHFPLAVTVHLG